MSVISGRSASFAPHVPASEIAHLSRGRVLDVIELRNADFNGISGKFRAQITIAVDTAQQLELLKRFCADRKDAKLAIISFGDSAASTARKDFRIGIHYRNAHSNAVQEIIDNLDTVLKDLANYGLQAMRIRLEHQSLPTIEPFTPHNYRETHIKLGISVADYEIKRQFLDEHRPKFGYLHSATPSRHEGRANQFITIRNLGGSLEESLNEVDTLSSLMRGPGRIDVRRIDMATIVFDTNPEYDAWV